jgi:RimJ/RimL family protein N-acetyltransferase
MSRFLIRALQPTEHSAFAAFEMNNREAYEQFNEPHPDGYYSEAGLRQAFNRLVARQSCDRYETRITTCVDQKTWVAKGSLTVHSTNQDRFGRLVYQTDQGYWKQGVGRSLLADLLEQARRMRLPRVDALIAVDNVVSLHLLRQSGFKAVGWVSAAQLRRGQLDCLQLSRTVRDVDGAVLPGAHVHLTA